MFSSPCFQSTGWRFFFQTWAQNHWFSSTQSPEASKSDPPKTLVFYSLWQVVLQIFPAKDPLQWNSELIRKIDQLMRNVTFTNSDTNSVMHISNDCNMYKYMYKIMYIYIYVYIHIFRHVTHVTHFPDLFSKLESFQALHHVEDLPSHGDECLGAEIDTKVVVVSGFAFWSFFCWQSEKLVDKLWGLWMLSTGSFWCGPRNLPGAPKMRQFSIEGLESTAFTLSITSSTEILFKLMISFLFDLMMFCGFLSVWKRETHGFQVEVFQEQLRNYALDVLSDGIEQPEAPYDIHWTQSMQRKLVILIHFFACIMRIIL